MADAGNVLQHLLEVEGQAEALVKEAELKREEVVHKAQDDAAAAEVRFQQQIPEIHALWRTKAEERASQAIAEQARRYEERESQLQQVARDHRDKAIAAAVAVLMDFGVGPK
ncbi:MAG: ATPase [Acidiferrobacter sp.]